jgi:GGDEF domain-containing protein
MWSRWLGIVLFAAGACLAGAAAAAGPASALDPAASPVSLDESPHAMVPRGTVGIKDVAAGALASRMERRGGSFPLNDDDEAWMALKLRNSSRLAQTWDLQLPLPSLDEVTLFERRGDRWLEHQAGDRVPQSQWAQPGRAPRFLVRFEPGETREIYLRVRNKSASPVLVRAFTEPDSSDARSWTDSAIGFLLGALAITVAACLVQAGLYRDGVYFLYGAYALLLAMAFAAISGFAGQHLWPEAARWGDTAKAVFPLAAAGISVWLVRSLCRVRTRESWLARTSAALGAVALVSALLMAVLQLVIAPLLVVGMLGSAVAVVAIVVWALRRGDPMGGWVLAAHLPIILVTAVILLRIFGLAPVNFDPNVVLPVATVAILLLLLLAVNQRSADFISVRQRDRRASSVDATTGLLARETFRDRLRSAVRRYGKSRHNAVIVYVRVVNHLRIQEVHGDDAAEQAMIRAALKLQRLVPEADCYGRVGDDTLALILETVTHRPALMERASRLVAHGLMPLEHLKPEVPLNLHVVANVLSENPLEADALERALANTLASMSPRTRRPIRFLEPGTAVTAGEPEETEPLAA